MSDILSTTPASFDIAMMNARGVQQTGKTTETAKEFEAVFLSQMVSHMFEGIGTDPMFGGGAGEEMFRGMLMQEYGKMMVKSGGVGLSDQLQKMMIQMQQG